MPGFHSAGTGNIIEVSVNRTGLRATPISFVLVTKNFAGCESPLPPEKLTRPVSSQLEEMQENWQEYTNAGEVQARHEIPLSFRDSGK